ncbi:hypothetical protein [Aliikangiella sp. IMCC44359]|uniref:hypothetical protein n=1 Tax=Aliikangiella sp. IMCC44359 TaxID=3459125 RepID=UPI00403B23F1
MSQKIFFKQQEIKNVLLESREVMDITAHFLCALLNSQFSHDQQNIIYSLALSYAQMEQQINDSLNASFSINVLEQKHQAVNTMVVVELKEKLKQLGVFIDEI